MMNDIEESQEIDVLRRLWWVRCERTQKQENNADRTMFVLLFSKPQTLRTDEMPNYGLAAQLDPSGTG